MENNFMETFAWPVARAIDLETYPRRRLFEHFSTFEIPVVSRTLQIDVSGVRDYAKRNNRRFSLTLAFILTRATNHVPQMRHRIQDDILVDFDRIIPSFTLLSEEKIVYFSKGVFTDHFDADYARNLAINERAVRGLDQIKGPENQGQIFITNIPWYSFTSIQHPYCRQNASIPVFSIGKLYEDNGRIMAPFGIQTHHALTDGYHIGLFLEILERHLQAPALIDRPFAAPGEAD